MSNISGNILVITDAPVSMTMSICQRMQVNVSRYQHDRQSIVKACDGHWDLLIIESIFDIQDAIRSCRRIRAAKPVAQIFMVSRQCTDSTIHDSLLHGADDHICSPFSEVIFQARISAALRRSYFLQSALINSEPRTGSAMAHAIACTSGDGTTAIAGDKRIAELFQLLPGSKKAIVDGVPITLTKTELMILSYFISNLNLPCEKFEMLEKVLGYKDECYLTSLYSHINRLRKKLVAKNLTTIQIETIWRYGYKLVIT